VPDPFRVLVTGARKTTLDQDAHVRHILKRVTADARCSGRLVVVIEGECPHDRVDCAAGLLDCPHHSVDLAARRWAEAEQRATVEPHPGDWHQHGRATGPIRNAEMVATGADICLAFPGDDSVGTWDCVKKAARAGIVGRVYPLGATP
jgi:hypothetical protein